jgi:hypothetical protein
LKFGLHGPKRNKTNLRPKFQINTLEKEIRKTRDHFCVLIWNILFSCTTEIS